ncbi:diaminopimelate decarboxylase [Hornefia butyriciproducens]|uniref:Diaminopimelate decarboxylase n=1 Tax=Hornefia butyriciproducens TaxID=2652293 RepID=A0A6L5Y5D2_9FIRM|nr:diaminopimelate decarboxylase [Hornefia butyriciproducens]MST51272.1 diaminopimelate decarboxylase [Hornefia butyriciproducens]
MIKEVKNNVLYFDGCNTVELAKKYGTPLYVYSESDIHARIRELKETFLDRYPGARVAYAGKAFLPLSMARIIRDEDICVDVVSGGELYTALKAGVPAEHIEFNGNNKLRNELEMAVESEIGRIIVDGLQEMNVIEEICRAKGKTARILIRITPNVKVSSHDYIVTGKKDSKFGIPQDDDILMPLIRQAIESPVLDFYGIHFHIGSQLFENEFHLEATQVALELVKKIKEKFGYDIREINVGGGFGATYTDEERKPYSYFLDPIMEKVTDYCGKNNLVKPAIAIEPGRSVVAEAGITLYTVGAIKEIPGVRKYVAVDGGMTDNIRPALYQAVYTGVVANRANEPKKDTYTICGKCCESGDIVIKDLKGAAPQTGDIFVVFSTGAYGYSMASNYNKNTIPGVVFVREGRDRLVVKAQSYEDMISREI